jgi:hypothetical protein
MQRRIIRITTTVTPTNKKNIEHLSTAVELEGYNPEANPQYKPKERLFDIMVGELCHGIVSLLRFTLPDQKTALKHAVETIPELLRKELEKHPVDKTLH